MNHSDPELMGPHRQPELFTLILKHLVSFLRSDFSSRGEMNSEDEWWCFFFLCVCLFASCVIQVKSVYLKMTTI